MLEEWARQTLARELRRDVAINDDGSAPGMYDLRIGPTDAPEMAIECVGAVDPVFTETWNIGPAKEPLQLPTIRGDWRIVVSEAAKVKKIKQHVERLLRELEDRGIHGIRENHLLERHDEELFNALTSLGITCAYCFRSQGTGEVHLGMPGFGGPVDTRGVAVPEWVGDFLRSPQQADVLAKLGRSGAVERHVFVFVDFHGVPWPVESYLSGDLEYLPAAAPNLPDPVTGVWIAYRLSAQGIRWDSTGWRLFKT